MSPHHATITLRPERPADETFLFGLYGSTRKEEMDAAGWPEEMRAAFLNLQFKAQQQGYHGAFPQAEFLVILLRKQAIGRLVVHRSLEEIRLVDLALLPGYRSRGIGTALLQKLMVEAAASSRPLRLSVIRGQRACKLYERLGFAKTGEAGWHDQMEWRAGQPLPPAQSAYEIQSETAASL